jgi:hypothetical protein
MAMKKAIIRTEVEYDDNETNPNDIAQELIDIARSQICGCSLVVKL